MWFPSRHPSLWTNTDIVIMVIMMTWGRPNTLLPPNHRTLPRPGHSEPSQCLVDTAVLELKLHRREASFSVPPALAPPPPFVFIRAFLTPCGAAPSPKELQSPISWFQREVGKKLGSSLERWDLCTCTQVHNRLSSCWTREWEKSQNLRPPVYRSP